MLRDATHGSVLPSTSKLPAPVVTRWSVFPAVVPGEVGSFLPPFLLSRLSGHWSAPAQVVPEAGLPEAAQPEPAIPEATGPDAAVAQARVAEAAVPQAAFTEPFLGEAVSTDSVVGAPAAPEPLLADPVLTEPAVMASAFPDSIPAEPVFTDPVVPERATVEPPFPEAVFAEEPAMPFEAADPGLTVEESPGLAEEDEEAAGEFPQDAFFIPEEVERVTSGVDATSAETVPAYRVIKAAVLDQAPGGRLNAAAATLAERLERFARLLRENGPAVLPGALTSGDRLDLLLAGLLTGYLVANDD